MVAATPDIRSSTNRDVVARRWQVVLQGMRMTAPSLVLFYGYTVNQTRSSYVVLISRRQKGFDNSPLETSWCKLTYVSQSQTVDQSAVYAPEEVDRLRMDALGVSSLLPEENWVVHPP